MRSVLFVDDERRVLDALGRNARASRAEWQCSFAESANAARIMIQSQHFDAVVSDMNMPGETGLDLLKWLKGPAGKPNMPFLMLTGNAGDDVKAEIMRAGADDFLRKPCDFMKIAKRVSSAIQSKRNQAQLADRQDALEAKIEETEDQLTASGSELYLRAARAAERRDQRTRGHLLRIGMLSGILGRALNLESAEVARLELASTLHDIGKIKVSAEILNKESSLTDEEWAMLRGHSVAGAEILRKAAEEAGNDPMLIMAAKIALCHHERWDGQGYPLGIEGPAIPLAARIVAVCDSYDAMRSDRPYSPAIPADEAKKRLTEASGQQLDPDVVAAFILSEDQVLDVYRNHGVFSG